ncbi:MAG: hypothetical protein NVSMB62_05750 [Acidobacteriaceae bacterium]
MRQSQNCTEGSRRLAILVNVIMRVSSPRTVFPVSLRRVLTVAAASVVLASPLLLGGCNRAAAGTTVAAANPREVETARQQMELIPPPSKNRYMAVHSLPNWENPYLTVQENMVTLHVTMADPNHSDLGVGGMLRPTGARRQVLNIRVSDLPASLSAIPEDAWPYGRVVAVEEAHGVPATDRPSVRRNLEAAMKTLGDLGVVVYEWNETAGSVR